MEKFIKEFKEFAIRGNLLDMAVGVVIGAAFGKMVSSLVENILMPLLGIIFGGIDFTTLVFTVRGVPIKYGMFIQSIFDFFAIALAIFIMIKFINRLRPKQEKNLD